MKTPLIRRSLALLCLLLPFYLASAADNPDLASVLKKRDAVLTKIVSVTESCKASGLLTDEDIWSAQVALYAFRRDRAVDLAEKIKNQELIVQIKLKQSKNVRSNTMDRVTPAPIAALLAEDSLLAEQQKLAELVALTPKS